MVTRTFFLINSIGYCRLFSERSNKNTGMGQRRRRRMMTMMKLLKGMGKELERRKCYSVV